MVRIREGKKKLLTGDVLTGAGTRDLILKDLY